MNLFNISHSPTEELKCLLENNIIGTPGKGMLYKQMYVRQKISSIAKPYFVSIQKVDKILGTCCFCKRDINNEEEGAEIEKYKDAPSYISSIDLT